MRTIPDIASLPAPLEDAIHLHLIPALTGFDACSSILGDLLALPCHLGGMGIDNPIDIADPQFDASVKVTAPLKELIVDQSFTASPPDVYSIKADVHSHHRSVVKASAQEVYAKLSQPLRRAMDLNSEKDSSSWLTVLPFRDQGSICLNVNSGMLYIFDMVGLCPTSLIIVCVVSVFLLIML